jgi:hypothetical protein
MDGDQKFVILFVGIAFLFIMGGSAFVEYSKYSCRMELGKSGRSAADIVKLCK